MLILAQLVYQLHIVNPVKVDTICNLLLILVQNVRPHAQFVKLQEILIVQNVRLAIIWIPPFANHAFPLAKPAPHSLVAWLAQRVITLKVEVVISALPNVWLVLLPKQLTALIAKLDTTLRTPPAQVFKIKYIFYRMPLKMLINMFIQRWKRGLWWMCFWLLWSELRLLWLKLFNLYRFSFKLLILLSWKILKFRKLLSMWGSMC